MSIMRLSLFAVLVIVLCGVSGAPAIQHPHDFQLIAIPYSAVHHGGVAAPRIRNRNGASTNWSGYAVETKLSAPQNGAVTDVKGTWVVPTVQASTSANTYSSTWVGIDGYSDSTVEQLGTEQDWSSGAGSYYAWFEMYPKGGYLISGFPVNPGDTITAEVQAFSTGLFTLKMTNVTQNVSFSTNQRNKNAKRQSAEWIVEAPWSGGVLPLADFGTENFSACATTINGHTGTISDPTWQNDPITMETSSGTVKAQPSALSPDGSSFSDTWYHE